MVTNTQRQLAFWGTMHAMLLAARLAFFVSLVLREIPLRPAAYADAPAESAA